MKTSLIPCYHKISSGLPKMGVLSCECRTFSCGVGVVCEACHTLEFDALSLNLQPHFYTSIWDTSMIWLDSDALKPPLGRNPITSWSEVNHIVYPFDRHREGVDQWDCILCCVSVGHGNIWRPVLSMLSQDFLRFAESGSFELSVQNLLLRSRCRVWSLSHFRVWCFKYI